MLILGIDTTCDDTGVGLVEDEAKAHGGAGVITLGAEQTLTHR